MNAKQRWKVTWRAIRVSRRETKKAAVDIAIYGTGAVFIPNDGGDPQHVPLEALQRDYGIQTAAGCVVKEDD